MKNKIKSNINPEQSIIRLLEILVCPKTGGKLIYDKKKNDQHSQSAFEVNCQNMFPQRASKIVYLWVSFPAYSLCQNLATLHFVSNQE